ncbi:MAG: alpha-hydroxy-acid oxidizing protein [Desulfamplus sp.]|nr:alpha-hydroxy-acid oxidizing protein [Desulfamplus sp.]
MATIDLSTMPIRMANEVIRGHGAAHENIEIVNPDARHYIAVGLTNPVRVLIHGSAGYFCGGLSDGPHIEVENNVSWGVGDNMLAGTIIVNGNAGAIAGEALRGGNIVIKGNMGSRAGQVMKKGTLCCAGNASFMAGYMMYGGRIIILGNSGDKVGENMAGGEIYVGGKIQSVGADAMVCKPSEDEIKAIMAFLDKYSIPFSGRFRKIVCAGNDLRCGKPEPRFKNIPFTEFSGSNSTWWNRKVQEDIHVKSRTGRYRVRGYGTSRHLPHFNDIGFRLDINRTGIADINLALSVDMRTFIGSRNGGKALDLSMPVMIAPMSLGAVSPRVKIALGIASRLSGICENTGEGGMYSVERAEARLLIAQCLSGRLGWNIHDMKRADALELYISQGATPGLGGQLMAAKLTKEISSIIEIPHGMDLRSPSRHPDILGGDDLIMKVLELREAVGWKVPVSLKLGGGRTRDDVKIAYKDGIDFVVLDGLQGGTGAGGNEVIEYVGIPTISALMEALDGLDEIDAEGELPIVLMGGIQNGVDAAKAIALGATAVGVGTPMLIAAGCTGCMQCSTGSCPLGIATQTPEYVERFNVEKISKDMHNYLESFRLQLATVTSALGRSSVHELCRDDLVALTPEAAAMTRLPYAPEYSDFSCGGGTKKRKPNQTSRKGKETGTAGFSKRSRDIIKRMSRTHVEDTGEQQKILETALQGRDNPFPSDRPAHLDDVVFLSAALTRLVIDPYREECSTKTRITRTVEIGTTTSGAPFVDIELPFLFTGFDDAPEPIKRTLGNAIASCGCGYIGRAPLTSDIDIDFAADAARLARKSLESVGKSAPRSDSRRADRGVWFQLLTPKDAPSPDADALIYLTNGGNTLQNLNAKRLYPNQLLGLYADARILPTVLPYALSSSFDILLIDTTSGIRMPWVELGGSFDLTVIRDAILRLRSLNMEEEICLINFGGLRSGTDVAKALALNCNASVFGVAMAIALGGRTNGNTIEFPEYMESSGSKAGCESRTTHKSKTYGNSSDNSLRNESRLYDLAVNWIKGTAQETAIIARCAGKSNVHNLEPEDMRSISIATSEALGIHLTSGDVKRRRF